MQTTDMIKLNSVFKVLKKNKVSFFSGVPDSILKSTKDILKKQKNHFVMSNEGLAVSLALGHYLKTRKLGCVYLQNSGLGNIINPIISIASKDVYSLPVFLLIGWRGAPNSNDEPQHLSQGKITLDLLKLLKIKYIILKKKIDLDKISKIIKYALKNKLPVACVISKKFLKDENLVKTKKKILQNGVMRHIFIKKFLENIDKKSNIISTTGYTSRELHKVRNDFNLKKGKDFYMVGGMGHSSSLSLGVSLGSNKSTYCLDGDGSLLMHAGILANIGFYARKNFKHVVLNNSCHESVGGEITNISNTNLKKISLGFGYRKYFIIKKMTNLDKILKKFLISKGPSFLEVKTNLGTMKSLGRPKNLKEIKNNFIY